MNASTVYSNFLVDKSFGITARCFRSRVSQDVEMEALAKAKPAPLFAYEQLVKAALNSG